MEYSREKAIQETIAEGKALVAANKVSPVSGFNAMIIKLNENLKWLKQALKDEEEAAARKVVDSFQPRVGVTGMIGGTNGDRNVIDIEFIRNMFDVIDGEVYHKASNKLATWDMKVSKDGTMMKKHVTIDTKYFNAHRIVYAWYHGVDIDNVDISHIDGNYMNNKVENLVVKSTS